MRVKIGNREFEFEKPRGAPNRFNIMEVTGGKRIGVGDGIIAIAGPYLDLRNIEIKPEYRGTLGASLIRASFRFLAETFPKRKMLRYRTLIMGKPERHREIPLARFRQQKRRPRG